MVGDQCRVGSQNSVSGDEVRTSTGLELARSQSQQCGASEKSTTEICANLIRSRESAQFGRQSSSARSGSVLGDLSGVFDLV